MSVLAAVVTMKSRGDLALQALRSLKPQVDKLCLYLNDYSDIPAWLPNGLVDEVHLDPGNTAGDMGNLYWADKHKGYYLSCDDDLTYAPQYSFIMVHWLEHLRGQALVTTHGLRFKPHTQHWRSVERTPAMKVRVKGRDRIRPATTKIINGWEYQARWDQALLHAEHIHQPGSGVLGFDTRVVPVPSQWPEKNNADLFLGIWAYQQGIPVVCIPHGGWECADVLPPDSTSLWKEAKAQDFTRRNELIRQCTWERTW